MTALPVRRKIDMLKKSKAKKIYHYETSIVGSSHLKKGSVCQDSHKVVVLDNGWCIAAIADGVGSAAHSEIASNIAVNTVIEYCTEKLKETFSDEDVKKYLFEAYTLAEEKIELYANEQEHSITEYDTTLSAIVYDGSKLIYGHSGDGGIVGLSNEGLYVKITNPQKADDGVCVIPLRAGEKGWEFGIADGMFASVLLATDGIYDTFFPYLLKGQKSEVYVPLIRFFMDSNGLNFEKEFEALKKHRLDFLSSESYSTVTDDKTLVVIMNSKVVPAIQSEDYYKEPDWDALQIEWNKKAYPHMFTGKSTVSNDTDKKE